MAEIPFNPEHSKIRTFYDNKHARKLLPPSQLEEIVVDFENGIRGRILELPSHEEGIDMDRVHNFRRRMGIAEKPIRILTPEDYNMALTIAKQDIIGEDGRYLYRPDVIVGRRDPEKEELQGGPLYTESMLVHEIAHSDISHMLRSFTIGTKGRIFRRIVVDVQDSRIGFVVNTGTNKFEGHANEEGYAELLRGMYLREELGMNVGFGGRIETADDMLNKYSVVKLQDGEKLAWLNQGGSPAYILERLIAQDPTIFSALRASRYTVEGLREYAKKLEAVSPGLYHKMRKIDFQSEDGGKQQIEEIYALINVV